MSAGWKRELRRGGECIPIERFGEDLTPREHSHLAHCARCQAELALWKQMNGDVERPGEAAAVQSIAAELGRRLGTTPSNVVPLVRPAKPARFRPAALAAAAAVVVAVGIGVFVQNREPAVEGPATVIGAYRSASVDAVAPVGDVAGAPDALRWKPVAGATRYDVEVMEVDRTVLWRASTSGSHIELPAALVAQFVPGKSVLWQVEARREQAIIAGSGMQRFRVSAAR